MPGESYEQRWRAKWIEAARDMAKESWMALVKLFVYYFDRVSRERYGVGVSVDLTARRVVVRLLPIGSGDDAPEPEQVRAYFGRPTWSAGQIVGKKVRVWQTEHITVGEMGPSLDDTVYVVDDVLEP